MWLNQDDIDSITRENCRTVLTDIDGNARIHLDDTLSDDVMCQIVHLCNHVYAQGIALGRAQKAREIRQALAEE